MNATAFHVHDLMTPFDVPFAYRSSRKQACIWLLRLEIVSLIIMRFKLKSDRSPFSLLCAGGKLPQPSPNLISKFPRVYRLSDLSF